MQDTTKYITTVKSSTKTMEKKNILCQPTYQLLQKVFLTSDNLKPFVL